MRARPPFALSLSKGAPLILRLLRAQDERMRPRPPFALSLSKGPLLILRRCSGGTDARPLTPFTLSLSKGAPLILRLLRAQDERMRAR